MTYEPTTHKGAIYIEPTDGGEAGNLVVSGEIRLKRDGVETPLAALKYTHTQSNPATEWVIDHNLNTLTPQIVCYDSTGDLILVAPEVVSANRIKLTFVQATSGKAVIS